MPPAWEQRSTARSAASSDSAATVLGWLGAMAGIAGAVLCLLALWRGWPAVVWSVGAAVLGLGLVLLAWRRGRSTSAARPRRAATVGIALLVTLALAAVPVLVPALRSSAEVAWSIPGSEQPVAEAALTSGEAASVILTVDARHVLRARQVDDGAVAWEYPAPDLDFSTETPVEVAGTVVLVGTDVLADPDDEAVALDLATGEQLWVLPANEAPLAHDGSVLVVSAEDDEHGDIHRGLDLTTGATLWTAPGAIDAWQSVPGDSPRPVVPFAEWLVSGRGGGDQATRYWVTEVSSGDRHPVGESGDHASAGIVAGQLVVQDLLTDPAEITYGSEIPTHLTAYRLPGGDVTWEEDLALSHYQWRQFSDRRPQLNTVDDVHLHAATEGRLDVIDLRDGGRSSFELPGQTPAIPWVHADTAIGGAAGSWLVLDLAEEHLAELPADEHTSEAPAATVWLDGVAAPVWSAEAEGLFGQDYTRLVALDLREVDTPEQVNLGQLPDGSIWGTYAGRVVLTEREASEYTAMHVLAPFD